MQLKALLPYLPVLLVLPGCSLLKDLLADTGQADSGSVPVAASCTIHAEALATPPDLRVGDQAKIPIAVSHSCELSQEVFIREDSTQEVSMTGGGGSLLLPMSNSTDDYVEIQMGIRAEEPGDYEASCTLEPVTEDGATTPVTVTVTGTVKSY
jgi:hypothetical protein